MPTLPLADPVFIFRVGILLTSSAAGRDPFPEDCPDGQGSCSVVQVVEGHQSADLSRNGPDSRS